LIHFMPGTAFACRIYLPYLTRLSKHYDIFLHDFHGHGESDLGDGVFCGWQKCVQWAAEVMDEHQLTQRYDQIIGMGHSYGGCMTLILAAQRPDLFSHLFLTDPFMVPEKDEAMYRRMIGPLVEKTHRKNPIFQDEPTVRQYLKGRFMFMNWHDEAIQAFIEHNLNRLDDGRLALKCAPSIEAGVYDNVVEDLWPSVETVPHPIRILSGAQSVPHFREGAKIAAERRENIKLYETQGSHSFMQERPQEVYELSLPLIQELLEAHPKDEGHLEDHPASSSDARVS
jgi:pimeloyl-ACP methyl ester carboxylesterase